MLSKDIYIYKNQPTMAMDWPGETCNVIFFKIGITGRVG